MKKKPPIEALKSEEVELIDDPPKAVLFVQYTANSELASEVKKIIQELRPWTGLNLKVVERGGQKLQDLLCKSNPWDNTDCGRTDCFTCISTTKSEKPKFSNCYQKSVVYETWCQTCLDANSENEISDNCSDITGFRKRYINFFQLKFPSF